MTTARKIIRRALQRNGVLTKTEVPTGDEATDGLATLNNMLSAWSNDRLLIYARISESFPLVSGQTTYTIGSGGNFNTARPLQLLNAFTRIGSIDYQMSIINDQAYDKITQKNIASSIPEVIMYEPSFPLGKLTIYPVPTIGDLHIRSEKELTQFASLDADVDLPPGWEPALIYNLAIETAGEYGQQVSEETYQLAMKYKGFIKTSVARNSTMDAYPYNGTNRNIYTGWYS